MKKNNLERLDNFVKYYVMTYGGIWNDDFDRRVRKWSKTLNMDIPPIKVQMMVHNLKMEIRRMLSQTLGIDIHIQQVHSILRGLNNIKVENHPFSQEFLLTAIHCKI